MVVGAGLVLGDLTSCSSLPVYKTEIENSTLKVPLSLFTENTFRIIRPENFDYDIAVQKQKDGSYNALLLRCTHAANQLTYTGSGYSCNLHGSKFDATGAVTRGPAEHSLKKFPTRFSKDVVVIFLSESESHR